MPPDLHGDHAAEESQLAHSLEQVAREPLLAVVFRHQRRNLALGELAAIWMMALPLPFSVRGTASTALSVVGSLALIGRSGRGRCFATHSVPA